MIAAIRSGWAPGPSTPVALADEVHLWLVDLSEQERFAISFSRIERDRVSRLQRASDGRRFMSARSALRRILGAYVGLEPAALRFTIGAVGRPELAAEQARGVRFSSSRAGDIALVAVTRERAVGVDIERIGDASLSPTLLRLCCSPTELEVLHALPAESRDAAFVELWTRKEAVLKATGDGLRRAPDSVCVLGDVIDLGERFTLRRIGGVDGYVASVAAKDAGWRFRRFELEACA
ncbi:MAG: 4'-phosphopantetheinyl transferase superfamily protein [Gemmatimonadota bacterium]|nr:4'-phosphopantetheinyl transferase superfamily protein [Gemmatimonadota bacterium]